MSIVILLPALITLGGWNIRGSKADATQPSAAELVDAAANEAELEKKRREQAAALRKEKELRAQAAKWGPRMVVTIVAGFFACWYSQPDSFCHKPIEYFSYFAALLHVPMQWVPLLAIKTIMQVELHVSEDTSKRCSCGLNWQMHFGYTLVLVAASPALSMSCKGSMEDGDVPIMSGLTPYLAKYLYPLYLYTITLLGAADQYLDATVAAAALACEWRLAWAMVLAFVVSIACQTIAACIGNKDLAGGFYLLMGVCPEGYINAHEGTHHAYEERKGYQVAVGIARLVTESLPQAYLQTAFVYEMFGSQILAVASIILSLILGIKCFVIAVKHCMCADQEEYHYSPSPKMPLR